MYITPFLVHTKIYQLAKYFITRKDITMNLHILNRFNPKILIALAAIIIGFVCTYLCTPEAQAQDNMQRQIAEKIIRFHVRANSDSDEDQALKLLVKDAVVEYLSQDMKSASSKEDSVTYIQSHIDDIKAVAMSVISDQGYDYTVNAYLTTEFFPTKSYGDVTIPCGEYDAFRIDIGENAGMNWWCVLYPPLCLVQGSYGIATDESKMLMRNVLDEDEFDYISNASSQDIGFDFKIKDLFR